MAAKEEKSNYTTIVAALAVASITLVLVLKDRETDHLAMAGASSTLESNATALQGVKRYSNIMTE